MKHKQAKREQKQPITAVAAELAALKGMTTRELANTYRSVFGEPTHSNNRAYLCKKIAWGLQARAEGGLSPRAIDRIDALATASGWRPLPKKQLPELEPHRDPRLPAPGTMLKRAWEGEVHEVLICEEDFEYRGQRYATLSRIASEITGTKWNGYLFFRLQKRCRKTTKGSGRA